MVVKVEEVVFNTLDELHNRLMPALKSKRKILNKSGYSYIKEEHIWDFMLKGKWKDSRDHNRYLRLCCRDGRGLRRQEVCRKWGAS